MWKNLLVRCALCSVLILAVGACKSTYSVEQISKTHKVLENWSGGIEVDSLPITSSLLNLFNDEQINLLVKEAMANNLDLKATALRLRASELLLVQTNSARFPVLGAQASKSRGNTNVDVITGKNKVANNNSLGLNVAWEVDLWGKLTDAHAANKLNYLMKEEEFWGLKDALAARVIQAWLNLTGSNNAVRLNQDIYKEIKNSNLSVNKKFREGLIELNELNQSNAELEMARIELQSAKGQHLKNKRTLEVLLGRLPETKIKAVNELPEITEPPMTIPSVVLQNRPDVKVAIAQVNAAIKYARSAKKDMLPSVNLSADMFKNAAKMGDVTGASLIWNVVGSLSQPIFQYGLKRNTFRARKKETEAALAIMQQTIYNALVEVEDALSYERELKLAQESLQHALDAYKQNTIFYSEKYSKGLVSFFYLVDARKSANQSAIQLNKIKTQRLNNRINLALALGYGMPVNE